MGSGIITKMLCQYQRILFWLCTAINDEMKMGLGKWKKKNTKSKRERVEKEENSMSEEEEHKIHKGEGQ